MGPYAKDKSNPQKLRQKILVSSILSDVNVVLNFAMQMHFRLNVYLLSLYLFMSPYRSKFNPFLPMLSKTGQFYASHDKFSLTVYFFKANLSLIATVSQGRP